MTNYAIPFNRAAAVGNEHAYIAQAIANGRIAGDGDFTKRCEALLEEQLGCHRALLTTSCTHALEMAAMLLDAAAGDEIIVPSFTFVSTINAFVLRGAVPTFADIRPDTLNLDETAIEALVTSRTKAIVAVHYAGVACEMNKLAEIAAKHKVWLVEDNAHGLLGKYRGKHLGTFSVLATQSFHETKNFTCGEGGSLLINDPQFVRRAEILREKGTDRSQFFRGQVDKYTWVDLGSSYVLAELNAAFLWAQLEQRATIQMRRKQIWDRYRSGLANLCHGCGWGLPVIPEECEHPYHMFYLLLHDSAERQALIAHLARRGILAVFHYLPLHLSPMGRRYGGRPGDCPVTEDVSERLLRLPFYTGMTEEDQVRVLAAVHEFGEKRLGTRAALC
jgi:dTDP-4-amino-4,6-dideoxygalactose transaminase